MAHNPDHFAYSRLARENGDKMLAYLRNEKYQLETQRDDIEDRIKNCDLAINAQERAMSLMPVEPARMEQRQEGNGAAERPFLADGSQNGTSVEDKAGAAVAEALGQQEA